MFMMRALILLVLLAGVSDALRFYVWSNDKKCMREEIHRNVVVTGQYNLSDASGYTASVHVIDTRGHTLYKRENFAETSGKFAFTADEFDLFEICFSVHAPEGHQRIQREVSLSMKHGVEAKNYEDLAKAEKLKPMEVELRRIEDLSAAIVEDFATMRKREEEMRSTNESTNSRVLYLSIFSIGVLLFLAGFQIFYLRNYFKAKKLID